MKCKCCGFKSSIAFPKCPICGAMSGKHYLAALLKGMFSWLRDRRLCLISKRQNIDRSLYRTHLLPPNCRGINRIWWVYRLFDVIPIAMVQDPVSVFLFKPITKQETPPKSSTNAAGMMS